MTRKEKISKMIQRIIYILLSLTFYILLFCFIDNDFLAASCLVLSLAFLCAFSLTYFIKRKPTNIGEKIKESYKKNPLSLDEIAKAYRYYGLNNIDGEIIKLYYSKNGRTRCSFIKESNAIKINFEEIEFFDDDTKFWTLSFAQWNPSNNFESGIYESEQIAYNEVKPFIKDFVEDETKIEKQAFIMVEIEWIEHSIESDLIPFGSFNAFDIIINEKTIKNIKIKNDHWFNETTSQALLYFNPTQLNITNKKFKFLIIHNNKIVGKGYFFNK